MNHKRLNRQLTIGIIGGILLSLLLVFGLIPHIVLGINIVEIARFVGTTFMLLLKMIVVPLVFFSVFCGVASVEDVLQLGKLGQRTMIYYLLTTFLAVCLGLLLVNVIQPGKGFQLLATTIPTAVEGVKDLHVGEMLLSQLETFFVNPFTALAQGSSAMIAVILSSLFFAIGVLKSKNKKKTVVIDFMNGVNDAVVEVVQMILKLAPVGICGILIYVAFDNRNNLGNLSNGLGLFALTAFLGLFFHGVVVLPGLVRIFSKTKLKTFVRGINEAMKVAFGTDSSMATIPVTLSCMQEKLGVSKRTADFVVPLGATINMNGTALYEAVCALFIAQALGIELSFTQQVVVFLTATIAAIGAAGIPSAGLVTLVIVINAVGIPYEQAAPIIGMIFAIDRLIDMVRTMVNVEGDCVGCVIIDELEKKTSP